ncbi:MAG: hypothetical protein DRP85_06280 [Candidatus Makaraimicrobium thalassicum]|nr:MAG: hypothetical protein DRP85_06280 [Candidatus Omnitrophota bacterium]
MFGLLKRKKIRRFGEIAVKRGLASEKDLLFPGDVKTILEEQKNQGSTMAWFSALFNLSR